MSRPIDELLPAKPDVRLHIYAYSINDDAHAGMLKVGQTTLEVKVRVDQQLKTPLIKNYTIHVDETAERQDGSTFSDHEVRARLIAKGFRKIDLEWVACTPADVLTAITELRTGAVLTGSHHLTPTFTPSGSKTCMRSLASSGTQRCDSARLLPPINWQRSWGR
jgi:hypothetical protein